MLGFYDYTVWLTYGSLLSSTAGLMLGFSGHPVHAALCLLICAALDTFDGIVARGKKNRTEKEKRFGIQIDSLSDLVAFGVLPGAVGYGLFFDGNQSAWMVCVYACAAYLLALAALIRLANFNVEEELRQEQTTAKRDMYVGVPVLLSAGVVPLLVTFVQLLELGVWEFAVFTASMPVIGLMFLLKKVHVKKPAGKGLIFFGLAGLAEVILLILCL